MFTGSIEEVSEIAAVEPTSAGARLTVRADTVTTDAEVGDSIAVNGVCLTVVDVSDHSFGADLCHETWQRSTLAGCTPGDLIHLERARAVGARLGGQVVQGHVDATRTLVSPYPVVSSTTQACGSQR